MPEQDPPYDPYISGPPKIQAVRTEMNEATQQMKKNLHKGTERGEGLDSLQNKTDNLRDSSKAFRQGANKVRKQMWWKDMKMRMCIIIGVIVLLAIIIIPIAVKTTGH